MCKYVVGCRGVAQLGGLNIGFFRVSPTKVGLISLFYSLKLNCFLKNCLNHMRLLF